MNSNDRFVWAIDIDDAIERVAGGEWYGDAAALQNDVMKTRRNVEDVPLHITVTRIEPEPEEQPQWWTWYVTASDWERDRSDYPSVGVQMYSNGTIGYVTVYGTTTTRDAKRDALLKAAKAAGKP